MILGIDEVGRGCWAGPLVVGAVVLGEAKIDGLTDSKALTKKRRQTLADEINQKAAVGLGWVSAAEIDEMGLSKSLRLATRRAVRQIDVPYHEIIIDGTINLLKDTPLEGYVTTLKKADLLVSSVSAASIVAKVARDKYMDEQGAIYSGYGFDSNVGYGTVKHQAAIDNLGVTPLHRLSFAPLAAYRTTDRQAEFEDSSFTGQQTTKTLGDRAEDQVEAYLRGCGHQILERNWKTKYCEIDIVSCLDSRVYFTEVKYRKNTNQGDGMAAVTASKLRQMKFAAEYYVLVNKLIDVDLSLAAASVGGPDFIVEQWLAVN